MSEARPISRAGNKRDGRLVKRVAKALGLAAEPPPAPRDHRGEMAPGWDEVGRLQLDYLVAAGLQPHHRLLDLGCGPLRAGVKLIPYLDPLNYFGVDSEKWLLDAGYQTELAALGLQERCPRQNLYCAGQFRHERLDAGMIDFGLCVSVLRLLAPHHLRICLEHAGPYFKSRGQLHMSFPEIGDGRQFTQPHTNMARFVTYGARPPFHVYRRDMEAASIGTGWTAAYVGHWDHPDGESMMIYTKR